ncbi:MAG: M48 family metallopeptidase [Longimicrobiales bacterium]
MSASSIFGAVFLAALALATATRLWLAARHVSHVRAHRARVPDAFAAEIGLDAHQKAADYTCARTRLAMTEIAFDAAVLIALTFGGALQGLHEASAAWLPEGIGRGLTLLVMAGALMTLLEAPFGAYRTFAIEARFGFNKMTPALYCLDFARSIALALAFGLPLGAIVLWLMASAGEYWWFYAWLTWIAFNAFMVAIYPTWIAPLFNRFSPMQDPELKERVERLMASCGFKVKGLMVMDGSRRSTHGNAYFTGFGTSKRIVFFDTLLARLNPGEVEAVLAHELGHFKLRHVVKRMAWLALASLALLWALGWIMQQPWFYHGLGVQSPSTAMALILFSIVLPQFTIGLQPLGAALSRRHEFEADRFAAAHASAQNLVSALIKLYRDNAATLTPDPLHSVFYDSHPPAIARIARLKST